MVSKFICRSAELGTSSLNSSPVSYPSYPKQLLPKEGHSGYRAAVRTQEIIHITC